MEVPCWPPFVWLLLLDCGPPGVLAPGVDIEAVGDVVEGIPPAVLVFGDEEAVGIPPGVEGEPGVACPGEAVELDVEAVDEGDELDGEDVLEDGELGDDELWDGELGMDVLEGIDELLELWLCCWVCCMVLQAVSESNAAVASISVHRFNISFMAASIDSPRGSVYFLKQ